MVASIWPERVDAAMRERLDKLDDPDEAAWKAQQDALGPIER